MLDSVFLVTMVTLSVVGILQWAAVIRRLRSANPAELSNQRESPFGLIDVILMFFLWVVFPGILTSVPMAIWDFPDWKSLSTDRANFLTLFSSTIQLAGCLGVALLLTRKYGAVHDIFGIRARSFPEMLLIAGKAFCMVIPFVLAIQRLLIELQPYDHETINQLKDNFSLATVIVTWFGAVLVAPVCEELLFRGVLQGWLQRIRFGSSVNNTSAELFGGWNRTAACAGESVASPERRDRKQGAPVAADADAGCHATTPVNAFRAPIFQLTWWTPILVSSLMFAAIHIGQGLAPVPLFFFALALGFLYRFSGSILPSVLLHLMLNGFSMFWVTLDSLLGSI